MLTVCSDKTARLWDAYTGTCLQVRARDPPPLPLWGCYGTTIKLNTRLLISL